MSKKTALFACFCALTAVPASAAGIAVIEKEIAVPPGDSRSFEFGMVPQRNTTVLLSITGRIHTEKLAGSYYLLKLLLNGREVEGTKGRGAVRLTNKPLTSPVTREVSRPWYNSNHGWNMLYAPDFRSGRKLSYCVGDPYTYVLDVTDLVNPAGENRLVIANLVDRDSLGLKPMEGNLVIQRLTIKTTVGESPMMSASPDMMPIINTGQPAAGPSEYQGTVLPGGGFTITVGEREWKFASEFSYPNAGLNHLLPASQTDMKGQPGWSLTTHIRDDGGEVIGKGRHYKLRRDIRFTPRKVEVIDELINLDHNAPLGLLVRHRVGLEGHGTPVVRLAGNADPTIVDYYSPPNPTVHISLPNEGLGLLCEDDVFRNQARLFYTDKPRAAGIRTEMLRLGPGETYSLRWSVYPVAGPDYFDFINLVRQDWGANFTVDGAWTFFVPDEILQQPIDYLRSQICRHGLKYAISIGNWVDRKQDPKRTAFGTGVFDDYWTDFRRRIREAASRIKEAAPHVNIMVYFDSLRDTSVGGPERFRDSWLTDDKGNHLSTNWSGRYSLSYSYVPTMHNSFGQAMLASVDGYLDETASDGIYWDEMEAVGYGAPLMGYDMPDGHSCILDPKKYTIQREVGIISLLCEDFSLAVIDRVRGRGGPTFGNSPPFTQAGLKAQVPRMVETQHNDYWGYEGNLGPPFGYIALQKEFSHVTRALRLACLPMGVGLDADYDILRFLFPFTPIELHSGYLLGKERIAVVHSGDYGWTGERCLVQARHFNRDGKLTDDDAPTTIRTEARTAVKVAEEEAVVLVRLPMRFEPEGDTDDALWNAEVRCVRYEPAAIELDLRAPHGGVLTLDDGEFALQDGTAVLVSIGDKTQTIETATRSLRVPVPAGFSGAISIKQP